MSDVWQISKLDHTGALRHTYSGELLRRDADEIVLRCLWDGADGAPIGPDRLHSGDVFYEYYYPRQWFNVFRIHDCQGRLKDWYCNITCPPEIGEGSVCWRDLALDLLVQPSGAWHLLDEDEYAGLALDAATHAAAMAGLHTLQAWVAQRRPPFDAIPAR